MKFDNSPNKRTPGLRLKFAADKTGVFEGYASTFGGEPDSYGDVIAPGAYTESLAAHKAAGTSPVMLWGHDPSRPIGRWLEMREDSQGLFVRGQCNLDTTGGKDAYAHVLAGDVTGMSIGYRIKEYSVDNDTGIWTLEKIDLIEVSVVAVPANTHARVTSKADLVDLLVKSGLPRAAAAKVAIGGFPALTSNDDTDIEALVSLVKTSSSRFQKA